jgi:hypothetical protein
MIAFLVVTSLFKLSIFNIMTMDSEMDRKWNRGLSRGTGKWVRRSRRRRLRTIVNSADKEEAVGGPSRRHPGGLMSRETKEVWKGKKIPLHLLSIH